MIIFTILVALTVATGAIALHAMYVNIEHKGYMRGMDEAEAIIKEVQNEFYKSDTTEIHAR